MNISYEQSSSSSISMLILLMDFDTPGSADFLGGALGRFAVVGDGCKCHSWRKCRRNDSSLRCYSSADSMSHFISL